MKRVVTFFVAAMLTAQAWAATTFTVGNLKYTVTDETNLYVSVGKGSTAPTGALDIPEKVTNPDNSVEYSVTSIGYYAFEDCSGLTSVTIPNSVTSIGYYAFDGCSGLTSVTIPNSVTSIRYEAFLGCSKLTEINVESSNSNYASENGVLFNKNKTTIACYPAGKTETTYTIPNSVTSIGIYAFKYCSGLTSVTIGNSVTRIGDNAFDGCRGLTSVTIPNSVTSIGSYAFSGCSRLSAIAYDGTSAPTIETNAFELVNSSVIVCIPENYSSTKFGGISVCKGLVHNNATEPTCTETGLTEGWHCSNCGRVFVAQEEIPALGHNYGTPAYAWAEDGSTCSATSICQRDESHVATENATITSAVTTAATCEGKGTTTYTATFENELFSTQTKAVVDIPALGHNYGTPAYAWAEDGSTCSATAICQRDETHVATENATITSAVTTAATCEGDGTTTYTATFENELFSTQTKAVVDILATGHTAAEAVAENYAAPTCTASGAVDSVVYCTTCKSELNRKTVEISATGHSYSNIVSAPTCTAVGYTTHRCSGCSYSYNSDTVAATGHTEAIDVAVAATCLKTGLSEGKHCSVCKAVIVAQDIIPALGHEFKTYTFDNNATTEADGTETALCEHGCGTTDTRTVEGTKIVKTPEDSGVAIGDEAASNLNIYAHHNIIVVENATDEIRVYDSMGRLVCRDATHNAFTEFHMNTAGVYIVKVGNVAKRVTIMD